MGELAAVIAVFGGLIGAIAAIFVASFLLGIFALWLAGRIMGLEKATFGNAAVASLIIVFLAFVLSTLFSVVPVVGTGVGGLVSIGAAVLVLQNIFETTWVRALICILVKWIVDFFAAALAGFVFGGSALLAALFLGATQ